MFVKAFGSSVHGIEAITIRIEVNVSMGQGYAVVGLPDSAVRESLHRTESAIKNMGYHMPRTKIIVNLAPADLRKTGSGLDLPIALGILGASEQLNHAQKLSEFVVNIFLRILHVNQQHINVLSVANSKTLVF